MYRHYVTVDDQNRVTDGWSTGEHPGIGPGEHDVFIGEGGEAFAILGAEHPALFTDDKDKIPLYVYDDGAVRERTAEEIDADRPVPTPEPEPSELERLRADVDYILAMEGLL